MKEDTLILTCKLGNEIINCYDGTHNKEQLKKWASKKILLCPACGKPYEYCHGEVKTPYFRHMDKNECEDKYSESETEEHLNGKRDLFEWIKKQNGVTNAVLEGWIPETKQRPDIIFEYNGKKYVIEYQCSPIATEYVERHDLYKASGIIDIWILGTEKYFKKNMRKKYIQDYSYGFYSVEDKNLIPIIPIDYILLLTKTTLIKNIYSHGNNSFYGLPLNDFIFNQDIYNIHVGKFYEVEKKQSYRKNINWRKDNKLLIRHNKILNLQNKKINRCINDFLKQLSNHNWKFHYTYFDYREDLKLNYISAEPITDYIIHESNFFQHLYIDELSYSLYKKCGRDIETLKKLLLPLMIENRKRLLSYKNEYVRFMEVRNN